MGLVKVLIVFFSLFHVAPPLVIIALLHSGKNETLIVSFVVCSIFFCHFFVGPRPTGGAPFCLVSLRLRRVGQIQSNTR